MEPKLDISLAGSFVYPSNYPPRQYQVEICKSAIDRNTLVVLPTGLGKTLIASVIMYNYYKWFPSGKVIFLAPTRPLVLQQIKACLTIMGIPEADTAQMEGSTPVKKRITMWESNRVFFCTPQTFQNDLGNGVDPRKVVLVVFDEAHRAQGSYSYVEIMNTLNEKNTKFRVLALSATPGSDIKKVQQVIRNLNISNLEIRSEDDPELKNYTHNKEIEYVTCEEGVASVEGLVKKELSGIMREVTNKLGAANILLNKNVDSVTKMIIEEAAKDLERLHNNGGISNPNYNTYKDHIQELMLLEDLRRDAGNPNIGTRLEEFQGRISTLSPNMKALVQSSKFKRVIALVKKSRLDNASLQLRQPKVAKLKTILEVHFDKSRREGKSTRVIVFCTLRTTVHDIVSELNTLSDISSHAFIGQSTKTTDSEYDSSVIVDKGLNQAEQSKVLSNFNDGVYNVLVATSIAEEGLDIAEVDLIILFDTVISPVRLVQRMGRTGFSSQSNYTDFLLQLSSGRKRDGRVIMLLFDSEKAKIEKSSDSLSTVTKVLQNRSKIKFTPEFSMLPRQPEMSLQNIIVGEIHLSQIDGVSLGNNNKKSNQSKKATVTNQQTLTQMMVNEHPDNGNRYSSKLPADIPLSPIDIDYEEEVLERLAMQAASCSFPKSSSATTTLMPPEPVHIRRSPPSPFNQNVIQSQHSYDNYYDVNDYNQYDFNNGDYDHYNDDADVQIVDEKACKFDELFFNKQYKQFEDKLKCFCDSFDKENKMMTMLDDSNAFYLTIHNNADSNNEENSNKLLKQGILKQLKDQRLAPTLPPLLTAHSIKNDIEELSQSDTCLKNINFVTNARNKKKLSKFTIPDDSEDDDFGDCKDAKKDETHHEQYSPLLLKKPLNLNFKVPEHSGSEDDDNESVEIEIKTSLQASVPPPMDPPHAYVPVANKPFQLLTSGRTSKFTIPDSSSDDEDDAKCNNNEETCNEEPEETYFDAEETCMEETCMETYDNDNNNNNEGTDHIQLNFVKISSPRDSNINCAKDSPPLTMESTRNSVSDYQESPQCFFTNGTYCEDFNCHDKTKDLNFLPQKVVDDVNSMKAPNPKMPRMKMQSSKSGDLTKNDDSKSSWRNKENSNRSNNNNKKRERTIGELTLQKTIPKQKALVSNSSKAKGCHNDDETDDLRCLFCFALESYDEDPILICDGCNQCTHMSCYNLSEIPSGDFYCEGCSVSRQALKSSSTIITSLPKKTTCGLCSRKGGIMKRSSCGSYIHLICQAFTPELSWDKELRSDLRKLDKNRKDLICEICQKESGACIQCSDKKCVSSCHPSCAYMSDWQMITRYDNDSEALIREIFCPEHEDLASYHNDVVDSKKAITFKERDLDLSIHDTPLSEIKRSPDHKRLKKLRKLNHDIKTLGKTNKPDKSDLKYAKRARERYFEEEADVSGSASDDERDESQELSGDFINDGEYTDDDCGGEYTQHAMYYRLNRSEEQSQDLLNFQFRGAEKGLPIIEKLLKKQKVDIPESPLDESFISYDNDSVVDSNLEVSPTIYSICSDDVTSAKKIGINDGSKKSTVSRIIHKMPLTLSSPTNDDSVQNNENIRIINQSLPYTRPPISNDSNKKPIKYKAPIEEIEEIENSPMIIDTTATSTNSQNRDMKLNNYAKCFGTNYNDDDDDW